LSIDRIFLDIIFEEDEIFAALVHVVEIEMIIQFHGCVHVNSWAWTFYHTTKLHGISLFFL
jgi:hypothetical protein